MSAPLSLKLRVNRRNLPLNGGVVFAMASIEAQPHSSLAFNTQSTISGFSKVAMAIVIDVSGSMSGEKLDNAKKGALEAYNTLSHSDLFTLISFESRAELVIPLTRVQPGDARIYSQVMSLDASGTTNMYEAIELAKDQLSKAPPDYVKQVIILTDGEVNEGVTDPNRFAEIARLMRTTMGASFVCIGLGDDYNEDLLSMIASESGGSWHHVRDPSQIPPLFQKTAYQAKTVVAVRPLLRIEPTSGTEILEIYKEKPMLEKIELDYPLKRPVDIELGNVAINEPQNIVMRIRAPPSGNPGNWTIARFDLMVSNRSVENAVLSLNYTTDSRLAEVEDDPYPRILLTTSQATIIAREGLSEGDLGKVMRARTIISMLETDVVSAKTILSDKQLKEMATIIKDIHQKTIVNKEKVTEEQLKDFKYRTTVVRRD